MKKPQTRPLILSIRAAFPHGITASSSTGLPAPTRSKVFARDGFSCVYCGFRSQRFQEIRPLNPDGEARPGRADDWVTACHMCDQCLSLERAGMMGEGILIWLPEMTQAQLNHTMRALYIAKSTEGEVAEAARRGLDALKARRDEAKRRLGTDDPMILAATFGDQISADVYHERGEKLEGIRFMSLDRKLQRTPSGEVDRFPDMLAYWKSKDGPFGASPPSSWKTLLERLHSR